MSDVLTSNGAFECLVCGHEWPRVPAEAQEGQDVDPGLVVKDSNGTVLASGDSVVLIKELKLKGGAGSLKLGTKVRSIRLVPGDHEIDCKIDGVAMMLKACFVKKA
jgi:protein PhnA